MSQLINELNYLNETKELLRTKLNLGTEVPFRDYASAISTEGWSEEKWQSAIDVSQYPSDWIQMPSINPGDQTAYFLFNIIDQIDNIIGISSIPANFTVDWGDGVVTNYFANSGASHTYDYSTLSSNLTNEGYKQALIKVSAQPGYSITSITIPFFTIASKINAQFLTSLNTNSAKNTLVSFELLENNISNFTNVFGNCCSLKIIPSLNTSKGVNFFSMFANCTTLVTVPLIDTSKCINFSYMFNGCSSLTTIPLIETSSGTDFSYMFGNCKNLLTIPLINTSMSSSFAYMFNACSALIKIPLIDTSLSTNFYNMFSSCSVLTEIPLLNTSKGTNLSYMFQGCSALTTIPLIDSSLVTNFSRMFAYCSSLKSISMIDTSKGLDFSFMFSSCSSLNYIPTLNTLLGTNFLNMFASCSSLMTVGQLNINSGISVSTIFQLCPSLLKASIINCKKTISFAESTKLSRLAIIEIFNNLASGVTGQTITVSSCAGWSTLTASDKLIATSKGWTVA